MPSFSWIFCCYFRRAELKPLEFNMLFGICVRDLFMISGNYPPWAVRLGYPAFLGAPAIGGLPPLAMFFPLGGSPYGNDPCVIIWIAFSIRSSSFYLSASIFSSSMPKNCSASKSMSSSRSIKSSSNLACEAVLLIKLALFPAFTLASNLFLLCLNRNPLMTAYTLDRRLYFVVLLGASLTIALTMSLCCSRTLKARKSDWILTMYPKSLGENCILFIKAFLFSLFALHLDVNTMTLLFNLSTLMAFWYNNEVSIKVWGTTINC